MTVGLYRFLTDLIYFTLWPVLQFIQVTKAVRHADQRLGYYPPFSCSGRPRIWLHAASVGEISALEPVVWALKRHSPESLICISVFTQTGYLHAKKRLGGTAQIIFAPLDFSPVLSRAFHVIKPDVMIFVETELWPNWIHAASKRKIPVGIINGRISPRSMSGYRRFKSLFTPCLRMADSITVIGENDLSRFIELGARPRALSVSGNAKFDVDMPLISDEDPLAGALSLSESYPVIVAGSTRPGEEEAVISCLLKVQQKHPGACLIIAPRHISRTHEVEKLIISSGLSYGLRTDLSETKQRQSEIVILNTLGELASVYSRADIIFCGGSLVPLGGQNVIEGALQGKPVLFGPHMDDFAESADLLIKAGGGKMVPTPEALAEEVLGLLADPGRCDAMGKAAKNAIKKHGGAAMLQAGTVYALLHRYASK